MSATNRYINWSGVGFTPTGGSLVAINGVTNVKFDRAGTAEKFKGDAAKFNQVVAVPAQERTAEVDTGDVGACAAIAIGTVGTLVASLGDALNGVAAAGGGKLYTLNNAVVIDNGSAGAHAKYGTGTLKFDSFATGDVDPLVVTAL